MTWLKTGLVVACVASLCFHAGYGSEGVANVTSTPSTVSEIVSNPVHVDLKKLPIEVIDKIAEGGVTTPRGDIMVIYPEAENATRQEKTVKADVFIVYAESVVTTEPPSDDLRSKREGEATRKRLRYKPKRKQAQELRPGGNFLEPEEPKEGTQEVPDLVRKRYMPRRQPIKSNHISPVQEKKKKPKVNPRPDGVEKAARDKGYRKPPSWRKRSQLTVKVPKKSSLQEMIQREAMTEEETTPQAGDSQPLSYVF